MNCLSKVFIHSIEETLLQIHLKKVEDTAFPPLCYLYMPAFYLQHHNRKICVFQTQMRPNSDKL